MGRGRVGCYPCHVGRKKVGGQTFNTSKFGRSIAVLAYYFLAVLAVALSQDASYMVQLRLQVWFNCGCCLIALPACSFHALVAAAADHHVGRNNSLNATSLHHVGRNNPKAAAWTLIHQSNPLSERQRTLTIYLLIDT